MGASEEDNLVFENVTVLVEGVRDFRIQNLSSNQEFEGQVAPLFQLLEVGIFRMTGAEFHSLNSGLQGSAILSSNSSVEL